MIWNLKMVGTARTYGVDQFASSRIDDMEIFSIAGARFSAFVLLCYDFFDRDSCSADPSF